MSESSDDAEISKLQRAAEFIRGVRLTQSGINKLQTGGNHLSPEQEQAITAAVESSKLVASVKESAQADLPVNHLMERFEEMCRRQRAMVDAELRRAVVKLLAAELWVNHKALDVAAEKLVSSTLHQGPIAPELLKDFAEYPRSVIAFAMMTAPASSKAFLQRARDEIKVLTAEPQFADIAEKRPSALYAAALHSPSMVHTALRKIAIQTGHWTEQELARKADKTVPKRRE